MKGKLKNLETEIQEVGKVLSYHRKEVDMLKLRKQTVEEALYVNNSIFH